MALKNKYQREKQQYTNDSGRTWIDVSPANYRRGRLIEAGSEDCNTVEWKEVTGSWFCIGFNETQYRWVTVSGEYVCVGHNKYEKLKKQESIDGVNWTDVTPLETKAGSLIEANSTDCGYVPPTPGGYENQYLTFVALEDSTFKLTTNAVNYSLDDGETWTALASGTASPTVTSGNKIMWKGEMTPISNYGVGAFSSTGRFNVQGNIMSLLFGDNFQGKTNLTGKDYAFYCLFSSNSNLVNAQNLSLPAITLAENCYSSMFEGCTKLKTAPELPATKLANYCYQGMFRVCTSLETAPELPATKLAIACYEGMFYRCTNLVNAPELPATTLAQGCYAKMFESCTSLKTAPTLPSTELVVECYEWMFNRCSSLNYIKAMFTTTPGTDYTYNWVSGVASTGTFVKNANATWDATGVSGVSGIPSGWTVVTE